jgi:hypothetical protein
MYCCRRETFEEKARADKALDGSDKKLDEGEDDVDTPISNLSIVHSGVP